MLMYFGAMGALFVTAVAFMIFAIWAIAHTNKFFGFIREGQGAMIMKGESLHGVVISQLGHTCERERGGRRRWEIKQGDLKHEGLILGPLEKNLGIYWFGLYPFRKRLEYPFRWDEWKEEVDEKTGKPIVTLWHREERTNFFYVQTFAYAIFLDGAETGKAKGGVNTGEEENVSVDVRITLFIRIIYPDIAIMHNENWFSVLKDTVLHHAREYVGSHGFKDLSSSANLPEKEKGNHEFSEYVMKLNEFAHIGEKSDSILNTVGVKIVGAMIKTVELAGASKNIAEATTAAYVAEQNAKSTRIAADAKAYEIEAAGTATANAFESRLKKVQAFGDIGIRVAELDALVKSGEKGNTIVFTDSKKSDEESERLLAGILVDKNGRKIK